MRDNILSFIGLAAGAGKLVYGSEAGSTAVRRGKIHLAVVAADASDRTKKLMKNKCQSSGVPLYEYSTISDIGRAVGRGSVSVICVSDKSFADEIIKKMGVARKSGS